MSYYMGTGAAGDYYGDPGRRRVRTKRRARTARRPRARKRKARRKGRRPRVRRTAPVELEDEDEGAIERVTRRARTTRRARAKPAATTRLSREVEKAIGKTVERTAVAAIPVVRRGAGAVGRRASTVGRAVAGLGAAAGLGAGATAATIAGAFALGYAIGTGLRALWRRLQPAERAYRQALAFRKARADFAVQYGRPPNADEVREMGRGLKDAIARIR